MRKKQKFLIEIRTNSGGWKVVELLGFKPNNRMLIKLSTGETIIRHRKRVRYGVTKRISNLSGEHTDRNYPNIKRRKRKKKNNRLKKKSS